ncbi:hypothetical protein LTR28_008071 [Elasticomyces elasticus]|nr:hypothetical protein LTR28_008071 [Elasticomyces elasticus]
MLQAFEAMIKDNVRKLSYSEAARRQANEKVRQSPTRAANVPSRPTSLRETVYPYLGDEKRTITIETDRTNAEKADFAQAKKNLEKGIAKYNAMEGVKIARLRPMPGERVNVVLATEADAEKARKHTSWLSMAMPGTRIKSEPWYPIKCDG